MDSQQPLVTVADHMAGFKDVPVSFKSGDKGTLHVVAPSRKQTRDLPVAIKTAGGFEPVFDLCLAQASQSLQDDKILDRLTMESANEVELICLTLTFGEDWFKKKFQPLLQAYMTLWESTEAKLFAEALAISSGKSTGGVTPSSPSSSD